MVLDKWLHSEGPDLSMEKDKISQACTDSSWGSPAPATHCSAVPVTSLGAGLQPGVLLLHHLLWKYVQQAFWKGERIVCENTCYLVMKAINPRPNVRLSWQLPGIYPCHSMAVVLSTFNEAFHNFSDTERNILAYIRAGNNCSGMKMLSSPEK